jgi:hypothetical protein
MQPDVSALFTSKSVAVCADTLGSTGRFLADLSAGWPVFLILGGVMTLCVFAYARAIYRHPIDWTRGAGAPQPREHTVETIARDAGA